MPRTDDELDHIVLYILKMHEGKENRVDRWDLVQKVFGKPVPAELRNDDNMDDRMIRYSVGRLRAAGHLICDLGDGDGRWIAASESELWEFYSYYVKPIKTKADVARALKKAAMQKWPDLMQPSLFDLSAVESV